MFWIPVEGMLFLWLEKTEELSLLSTQHRRPFTGKDVKLQVLEETSFPWFSRMIILLRTCSMAVSNSTESQLSWAGIIYRIYNLQEKEAQVCQGLKETGMKINIENQEKSFVYIGEASSNL